MGQFTVVATLLICIFFIAYTDAYRFYKRYYPKFHEHRHHAPDSSDRIETHGNYDGGNPSDLGRYDRPSSYDNASPNLGCSCLLYVEQTEVFKRTQPNQRWRNCNRRALADCVTYCTELFSDEGLRARSRQDACDVLGRPVHSNWYARYQVCGRNGLRQDVPLSTPLCCRRGRTSLECPSTIGSS